MWCSWGILAARHCGPNQLGCMLYVYHLIVASCQPNEASPGSEQRRHRGLNIVHATHCTVGHVAIDPETHPVSSRGMCCCVFRVSRNLVLEPGKIITQGGNWDIQPVVIKHIRSNIYNEGAYLGHRECSEIQTVTVTGAMCYVPIFFISYSKLQMICE